MLRSMIYRLAGFNRMAKTDRHPALTTCLTFTGIMAAWITAWVVKIHLDGSLPWITSSGGSFIYWTSAKLLLWVLPAYWLILHSGRDLRLVFNFVNVKGWLFWGGGIGLLIALTGWIPKVLVIKPLIQFQPSFALLNVLFIAPVFEEFLLRGAILGNFMQYHSFWFANIVTSLFFVILHLPGWFFMDTMIENLTKPVGGALSIFLVGLLFGYAVKCSDSLLGGILAHLLNNLA